MIKYSLNCENNHNFEAWFPNSDGFEEQNSKGFVVCPYCASIKVSKAIMAPAVKKSKPQENENISLSNDIMPTEVRKIIEEYKSHIEQNFDYVGDSFAKEARAIHDGDSEIRPIYGETTPKEAKELIEDGISIAPIPTLANPKTDKGIN